MKKLLVTALVGVAAYASYGQGTIIFQNANTSTGRIYTNNLTLGQRGSTPTTAGLVYYGVFTTLQSSAPDAASASNLMTLATSPANLGVNSPTSAGVIAAPNGTLYSLSYPESASVWLQVRAWDQRAGNAADSYKNAIGVLGYLYGASVIQPFQLGTAIGPGTAIWGTAAGRIPSFDIVVQVPEPSTIALVGVGLAGLLFIRRRK